MKPEDVKAIGARELMTRCEEQGRDWLRVAVENCNPYFVDEETCKVLDLAVVWLNRAAALRATLEPNHE